MNIIQYAERYVDMHMCRYRYGLLWGGWLHVGQVGVPTHEALEAMVDHHPHNWHVQPPLHTSCQIPCGHLGHLWTCPHQSWSYLALHDEQSIKGKSNQWEPVPWSRDPGPGHPPLLHVRSPSQHQHWNNVCRFMWTHFGYLRHRAPWWHNQLPCTTHMGLGPEGVLGPPEPFRAEFRNYELRYFLPTSFGGAVRLHRWHGCWGQAGRGNKPNVSLESNNISLRITSRPLNGHGCDWCVGMCDSRVIHAQLMGDQCRINAWLMCKPCATKVWLMCD